MQSSFGKCSSIFSLASLTSTAQHRRSTPCLSQCCVQKHWREDFTFCICVCMCLTLKETAAPSTARPQLGIKLRTFKTNLWANVLPLYPIKSTFIKHDECSVYNDIMIYSFRFMFKHWSYSGHVVWDFIIIRDFLCSSSYMCKEDRLIFLFLKQHSLTVHI